MVELQQQINRAISLEIEAQKEKSLSSVTIQSNPLLWSKTTSYNTPEVEALLFVTVTLIFSALATLSSDEVRSKETETSEVR